MVSETPSTKHGVSGSTPNVPIEPSIESTDVFITSWLSGGSPSSFCDNVEHLPTIRRTLRHNKMSLENDACSYSSSKNSSFTVDGIVSKSFDEESPTSPASSIKGPTQNHNDLFEFNHYRENDLAAGVLSSDSFDSTESQMNHTTNINRLTTAIASSKKSHRCDSSIPSGFDDRMLSTQGRFSFTGSPIHEHDESFFSHNTSPLSPPDRDEEDLIRRYTSKVRRLCLEDRPRLRLSQQELTSANKRDNNQRQLFSKYVYHPVSEVDTETTINPDINAEISPKDIFAFPHDFEMTHLGQVIHSLPNPTPPFDNITPIMTKKELRESPNPPYMHRLYHPSSPTTPSIVRKAKSRSMYNDDIDRPSLLAHPDRTAIVHQNNNKTSESRFYQDFDIVGTLGTGSYGTVFKCRSRLDGCTYAIKAAKKIAKGASDLDRMLREVRSLAALSDLTDPAAFHIVRYHQAWLEERRLFIQTELCTSTLYDEIKQKGLVTHDTSRRYKLLREMCLALDLIHRKEMVHLDIKPENIFIKNDRYKLGDFGLVNKTSIRGEIDEEGDSRYMAKDLLSGDHLDLTKVCLQDTFFIHTED